MRRNSICITSKLKYSNAILYFQDLMCLISYFAITSKGAGPAQNLFFDMSEEPIYLQMVALFVQHCSPRENIASIIEVIYTDGSTYGEDVVKM